MAPNAAHLSGDNMKCVSCGEEAGDERDEGDLEIAVCKFVIGKICRKQNDYPTLSINPQRNFADW